MAEREEIKVEVDSKVKGEIKENREKAGKFLFKKVRGGIIFGSNKSLTSIISKGWRNYICMCVCVYIYIYIYIYMHK